MQITTDVIDQARQLLRQQRWAALATLRNDTPLATMVAYVTATDFSCLYLHLSTLAAHSHNLQRNPNISMVISEPDLGSQDPQTLARLTVSGQAEKLDPQQSGHDGIRSLYIGKFPDSEMLFTFSDFSLYRVRPEKLRLVGGFAQAFNITPGQLKR